MIHTDLGCDVGKQFEKNRSKLNSNTPKPSTSEIKQNAADNDDDDIDNNTDDNYDDEQNRME